MEGNDLDFVFENDGALPELGFDFCFGGSSLGVSGDGLLVPSSMATGPIPPLISTEGILSVDETSNTQISSTGTSEEEHRPAITTTTTTSTATTKGRTKKKVGLCVRFFFPPFFFSNFFLQTSPTNKKKATAKPVRRKRTSRGGSDDDEDEDGKDDEEDNMGDYDHDDDDDDDATPSSSSSSHLSVRYVPSERPGNAFNFSKTELATMTAAELDAYAAQVERHHSFSNDETALFKKYRRQIRNRECAQTMRARKKQQVDVLSKTVDELKDEVRKNEQRAEAAEREAASLRGRVHYLEGLLKERNVPFQQGPSFVGGGSVTRKGVAAAATTTLFVFLFSVGLYMGPALRGVTTDSMPAATVASTIVSPPPIMGVANSDPVTKVYGGAVVRTEGGAPLGTSRHLLVAEGAQLVEKEPVARYVMRNEPRGSDDTRKSMRIIEKTGGTSASHQQGGERNGLIESTMVRQHSVPSPFESKFDRPDTEYMYCPVAHHITSTHKPEEGDDDPFPSRLSIIIPGDAFNESSMFRHMDGPPPLVEVTCSVVDIWPVWPSSGGLVTDK